MCTPQHCGTWGTKVARWTWEAMQDLGVIWTIGASLTCATAAVFGSSEPTGVDRHGTPVT